MSRMIGTVGVLMSMAFFFAGGRLVLADEAVPVPAGGAGYTAWPISIDTPSGRIAIFQPQPESLDGDKLKARAAVSLTPPGATDPVFGAIWLTARVATDRDTRTVTILDLTVRRTKFPDATDAQNQQFGQIIQQQVPGLNVTFALDQLMTSLDVAAKEKEATQELATTPPRIIFSTTPATLVLIDGQPQLQPTADQPALLRVVNTPFIILLDSGTRQYYLKAGNFWYSAHDVAGPWQNVGSIPGNVLAEGNALTAPPPATAADAAAVAVAPAQQPNPGQIIVSEEPAELISTDGQPTYVPLPGGALLYVSNTQSDVFLELATQQKYVLLSGRWFRAAGFDGPWEFVASDKLPAAFAQIPPDSAKGNVLASVAGTLEAKDARVEAQIPQTAVVDRNAGQSLQVAYDGEPQFEPIAQTPMSYCVNTPEAVLQVSGRYYCCHQAVWYEAAGAVGPWAVCTSVPDVIYTLPPSCPIYNVRFCYVYDSTPELVNCGYLPGYTGCYVYGPTVVFGTGLHYHGWFRHDYYARPCTWGFGVRYDRSVGAWGFGAASRYDRNWFIRAGDHRGWWGPRGFINYRSLPREYSRAGGTAAHNFSINRLNIYNRSENVGRHVAVDRSRFVHQGGHVEPARREPVHVEHPAHAENNVYAGPDGKIYRRTDQGWDQHTSKGWSRVNEVPEARHEEHVEHTPAHEDHPSEPAHHESPKYVAPRGLEADHAARQRGDDRAHGNEHTQGHR